MNITQQTDRDLKTWRDLEKKAITILHFVGKLRFDKGVEMVMYRRDIYDVRPSEIISLHDYVSEISGVNISLANSLSLVRRLSETDELPPAKIDLGKLAVKFEERGSLFPHVDAFLDDELSGIIGKAAKRDESRDVVLYGFGRIGRLLARRLIDTTGRGDQLRLKAIVLRSKMSDKKEELEKRSALFKDDSIHGEFSGSVKINENLDSLIINGNRIHVIFANTPEEIDYTEYGIKDALVIDNTGVWRDEKGLSKHLQNGVNKVLLTAPGKDNIPNIVHGVNQREFSLEENQIFSAASCTTNAIVPVIKVLHEKNGIKNGHIETIHAYTSDQNLLDNFHKKPRRGRAAALNMVLTSTGAASAVSKVLPELKGKLSGNAVRVPTPDVSLAILSLNLNTPTSVEEVNDIITNAANHGNLVEQIRVSHSPEFVSTHAVGTSCTSILDAPSTLVSPDGNRAILYIWYDNEYGYVCQVVRLAKYLCEVRRYSYY